VKKITPYLLVILGAFIIYLGATGSLPIILDSILVRAGLKNELDVSTMGFSPFAVPIAGNSDKAVAPQVEIYRSASGRWADFSHADSQQPGPSYQ